MSNATKEWVLNNQMKKVHSIDKQNQTSACLILNGMFFKWKIELQNERDIKQIKDKQSNVMIYVCSMLN